MSLQQKLESEGWQLLTKIYEWDSLTDAERQRYEGIYCTNFGNDNFRFEDAYDANNKFLQGARAVYVRKTDIETLDAVDQIMLLRVYYTETREGIKETIKAFNEWKRNDA